MTALSEDESYIHMTHVRWFQHHPRGSIDNRNWAWGALPHTPILDARYKAGTVGHRLPLSLPLSASKPALEPASKLTHSPTPSINILPTSQGFTGSATLPHEATMLKGQSLTGSTTLPHELTTPRRQGFTERTTLLDESPMLKPTIDPMHLSITTPAPIITSQGNTESSKLPDPTPPVSTS